MAQRPGHPARLRLPDATHGTAGIGELVPNVTIPSSAYKGFVASRAAIGDLPAVEAGETGKDYVGPARLAQRQARTTLAGARMRPTELHDHHAAALSEQTLARL